MHFTIESVSTNLRFLCLSTAFVLSSLSYSLLVPFTSPVWSSRFYQAATWALANDSSFAWPGWSCANPLCCCWTRQLPPSTPALRRRLGSWLDEKNWTEFFHETLILHYSLVFCSCHTSIYLACCGYFWVHMLLLRSWYNMGISRHFPCICAIKTCSRSLPRFYLDPLCPGARDYQLCLSKFGPQSWHCNTTEQLHQLLS